MVSISPEPKFILKLVLLYQLAFALFVQVTHFELRLPYHSIQFIHFSCYRILTPLLLYLVYINRLEG